MPEPYDVIVAGGGLSGLTHAIRLSQAGLRVLLVEKKKYPFHRVCGEYISNEVLPFLQTLGMNPFEHHASQISRLQITSPSGKQELNTPLDLGGFGISRFVLDEILYEKALEKGADVMLGKSVQSIDFQEDRFQVSLSDGQVFESRYVVGAFGKRSNLDKQLHRTFIQKRSPYIGVKYHLRTDFPPDLIALHNFRDGYCGVSAIEDGKFNLCYLTTRQNLKTYGSIEAMEAEVVFKNPHLKAIQDHADFLFDKPEVINEISFSPKTAVANHILMSGDAAGLITPLCGNGMAMAFHSAKILSDLLIQAHRENWQREKLENLYTGEWQQFFSRRLWAGRNIQKLFGNPWLSELAIGTLKHSRPAVNQLVSLTHGKVF
jgi:menaquinone-9 beta-reductase